ncbi:MAG: hypothetical protein AAF449_09970, partial [Myxococcota bacterium]
MLGEIRTVTVRASDDHRCVITNIQTDRAMFAVVDEPERVDDEEGCGEEVGGGEFGAEGAGVWGGGGGEGLECGAELAVDRGE